MKKFLSALLCLTMLSSVLAGCSTGGSTSTSAPDKTGAATTTVPAATTTTVPAATTTASETSGKAVEINMFINQPEYADAIGKLIAEYKTVKPNVTINYETTQSDYPTLLKAKLNSGDVPDIFASTAGKEIDVYKEYSLDLSDQPLMKTMLPAIQAVMADSTGKGMYGLAIKGNYFGLIYNKALFEQAGITKVPETMTELEAACVKLKAAGITPFTSGLFEWWVYKHVFQHFLDASTTDVPGLIKKFESGEAKFSDYPELYNNFFAFMDLVKKYGDAKPLETDLSAEIAAFASGKAAMATGQGAWIEADVLKIDPSIKIGFTGYPVSENAAQCQVITGSDQALRIYKDSKVLPEVLDFINWWYTSDYGKAWFTDIAGVLPPVATTKDSNFEIIKQGNASVAEKGSATLAIIYSTDSFWNAFGLAMQEYVGGKADKDTTCATIEAKWIELDGAKS